MHMRLILVRNAEHAQYLSNRWSTRETELSPKGTKQALRIADCLRNVEIERIYASEMIRAAATVEPLADEMAVDIQTEAAFNPLDIGNHKGRPYEDTRRILGDEVFAEMVSRPQPDKRYFDGGETLREMAERAWQRVVELTQDECDAQSSLVVSTHEEVIGAVLCKMADMPLSRLWWWGGRLDTPLYASITHVIRQRGRWILESFGNTNHLMGL